MNRTSFSNSVRSELAHVEPRKGCCALAELSAILRTDGSLHILGRERIALDSHSENAAVARLTYRLLTEATGLTAEIVIRRSVLHRTNDYLVYVPEQPELSPRLIDLGVLTATSSVESGIAANLVAKRCCAIAYLRGAFLGAGFVSHPRRGYHFELATDSFEFATDLVRLFKRLKLKGGVTGRRRGYSVYLKSGEQIFRSLALMGANHALLEFEETRLLKEIREQVNRLVNCDTANLGKSATAAAGQLADIELVDRELGLRFLPKSLQEFARLRIEYPSVSLKELGELSEPALSKSAIQHRAKRLSDFALELRGGRSERREV